LRQENEKCGELRQRPLCVTPCSPDTAHSAFYSTSTTCDTRFKVYHYHCTPHPTMSENTAIQTENENENEPAIVSFFADILKPGSSLHPSFLLALDVVLGLLFFVFFFLFFLTRSPHMIALMAIELGLWMSVKWFVAELRNSPPAPDDSTSSSAENEGKKDQ